MSTHSHKSSKETNQSVRNEVSKPTNQTNPSFQFVDNRPEAILQRKIQEMADNHSKSTFQFVDNRPESILQRKLQEGMNNSPQVKQQRAIQLMADSSLQNQTQTSYRTSPVVQRIVKIGTDTYEPNKRGYGISHIKTLLKEHDDADSLPFGWMTKVEGYVKDPDIVPKEFNNTQELIDHLIGTGRKRKRTAADKNREQDGRIQGMNTGFGERDSKRARILEYENAKVFGNFTSQVQNTQDYSDTKTALEGVDSGLRSTTSNFGTFTNPFSNFLALGDANLSRLDFMTPNGVKIDTHGYDSRGDRSVNPNTLTSNFGYGTIKVGPDISSYSKEMKSDDAPNPHQLEYLNSLEMLRLPNLAPQTAMKRELYNQGEFTKEQGMGIENDHTSVEFVGAISGGSMTNQQRENMRNQQTLSNYAILQTANNICPDTELGKALANGKHITTPKEEMDALETFITVIEDPDSDQDQKDDAKRALRRVLMQVLRGVTHIEEIESDDEDNYPMSPFYQPNYY